MISFVGSDRFTAVEETFSFLRAPFIFVVSSFNPPDLIGLPFHFVFGFAASFLLLLRVCLGVVYAPDDDDSWEED